MNREVIVVSVVLIVLVAPTPAVADDWFGEVTCGEAGRPACDLEVGTNVDPPPAPPDSPETGASDQVPARPCRPEVPPGLTDPSDQAAWREFVCGGGGSATSSFTVPIDPTAVARAARDRLELPAPVIAASPARDQLVHLPTWLWLSRGWATTTAIASVPGVTVTATATPRTTTWSMGDGTTFTCSGAGTPYSAETATPDTQSPDCGHTYRRSSFDLPGHTFLVRATIRWTISWSGAGLGGEFPDMTTTSTTNFRVLESQALNQRGQR